GANTWLAQAAGRPALRSIDADTNEAFRAWWTNVVRACEGLRGRVRVYPHQFSEDVGHAIDHTIRYMSVYGDLALAPNKYVLNLQQRNRWKAPSGSQSGFFNTAIHQIGGHGGSWQSAPEEHREDVLLLQIQGDDAFLGWHENSGCVLHFW